MGSSCWTFGFDLLESVAVAENYRSTPLPQPKLKKKEKEHPTHTQHHQLQLVRTNSRSCLRKVQPVEIIFAIKGTHSSLRESYSSGIAIENELGGIFSKNVSEETNGLENKIENELKAGNR